ncbi:GIY-YIG nuclease family protein [Laspinema sp. D1]|uniref:GIY-YIG nuclease family protein n=1 Tax=Laspinema palackyanum D2a TaxID=2953684 RepID=A0ABT2MM47_9CYAN|nr:GIY-YIG nuclease family protein [Laspinema sp. D2b]MCT7965789.1 GIY-YIG nuclease family protein [Laspinema sp. D2a]
MTDISSLSTLEFLPYLDEPGNCNSDFTGQVGVYAIFDDQKTLHYIGYSRDIALSLKQHLMRKPDFCYWIKAQTIERPSRTILEEIRAAWIAENGQIPPGNGPDEAQWTQAIDVKPLMTDEEREKYEKSIDELTQMKLLKQVSRRVEADLLAVLESRGLKEAIRFNPKLKESGLLDLK